MSAKRIIGKIFPNELTFSKQQVIVIHLAVTGSIPEWQEIDLIFHGRKSIDFEPLANLINEKMSIISKEVRILEIFRHLTHGFHMDEGDMVQLFQEMPKSLSFEACLDAFKSLSHHYNDGLGLDYKTFQKACS